jgi:hypothetical protein
MLSFEALKEELKRAKGDWKASLANARNNANFKTVGKYSIDNEYKHKIAGIEAKMKDSKKHRHFI